MIRKPKSSCPPKIIHLDKLRGRASEIILDIDGNQEIEISYQENGARVCMFFHKPPPICSSTSDSSFQINQQQKTRKSGMRRDFKDSDCGRKSQRPQCDISSNLYGSPFLTPSSNKRETCSCKCESKNRKRETNPCEILKKYPCLKMEPAKCKCRECSNRETRESKQPCKKDISTPKRDPCEIFTSRGLKPSRAPCELRPCPPPPCPNPCEPHPCPRPCPDPCASPPRPCQPCPDPCSSSLRDGLRSSANFSSTNALKDRLMESGNDNSGENNSNQLSAAANDKDPKNQYITNGVDETGGMNTLNENEEVWIVTAPAALELKKIMGAQLKIGSDSKSKVVKDNVVVQCDSRKFSKEQLIQVTSNAGTIENMEIIGKIKITSE